MSPGPHIVSDVMTRTVVAISRDTPFKDVVGTLEQWQVSALPVLAADGRVIGVVSEADLLPKEEFRDSDPTRFEQMHRLGDLAKAGAVTAGQLMTTPGAMRDRSLVPLVTQLIRAVEGVVDIRPDLTPHTNRAT
ncbi:CBS domain-containing protein [Streptomyces sp. NPDC051940]|uniref:CBS domain-containing protein n=1 Tax=Streptomyces sp. NPDC051940 TaxID=3155675 RepID=UPI0034371F76